MDLTVASKRLLVVADKKDFIDFKLAASDPKDYIGQRIIADSEHGEASFLKAAKFL